MGRGEFRAALRSVETLFRVGTVAALSDGQLIERFVGSSDDAAEAAFAALVERHGPMVLRVCRGVLRDAHSADDAFQATFLVLARKAGSIRAGGSVASWLFGVARRVACRAKAERVRRAAHERSAALAGNLTVDGGTPALFPEVQEEVDRLPEKYRAPIVLCYFEGLTHEEAAGQLRVPVGTVKVRLSRARGRLRGRLARRGLAPALLAGAFGRHAWGMLPRVVVETTIQAAPRVAAGHAGGVSAPVAALVKGVLRAMFLTRLKATIGVFAAAATVLVATTVLVSAFPRPARSGQVPAAPAGAAHNPAVVSLDRTRLLRTTTQAATVQAFDAVDLVPRISGVVKSMNVDIGDAVKHGQVLAELDVPELAIEREKARALVAQAEARLSRAKAGVAVVEASLAADMTQAETAAAGQTGAEALQRNREKSLDRFKALSGSGAVGTSTVDEAAQLVEAARSTLAVAKAQALTARAGVEEGKAKVVEAKASVVEAEADVRVVLVELSRADLRQEAGRIVAPFDGIITRRNAQRGEFVRDAAEGAAPVLSIVKTDRMRVIVEVPDRDAPRLDKGDPVTVRIDALGGRVYQGKIARTAYAESPETRTLRAEIDLDNSDGRLRPGQFGSATIVLDDLGEKLAIPLSALVGARDADGGATCFRVENGRAVRTRIKVGRDNGAQVEVVEGLKEGDSVVAAPAADLTDGALVAPGKERPAQRN